MSLFNWIAINFTSLFRKLTTVIPDSVIAIQDSQSGNLPDTWKKIKNLSPGEFSKIINQRDLYPYIHDKKKKTGEEQDNTIMMPEQFFMDRTAVGRDCDDWAMLWSFYAHENNYGIKQVLVWEIGNKDVNCHMTAIIYRDNQYYLCDYEFNPFPFNSKEQAIAEIAIKYHYKGKLDWSYKY